MKSDFADFEQGFSSPAAARLTSSALVQPGPEGATAEALDGRSAWNPRVCWWSTGWFEEWERAARGGH